jgi:hypothetical protein
MSVLYQRARNSGLCPPSLLSEQCSAMDGSDGFDVALYKVIDPAGTCVLRPLRIEAQHFACKIESCCKLYPLYHILLTHMRLRHIFCKCR